MNECTSAAIVEKSKLTSFVQYLSLTIYFMAPVCDCCSISKSSHYVQCPSMLSEKNQGTF